MPIVQGKRKREVEEELVQKAKRCKIMQHEMYSKIGYTGDYHHTLIREIPLIGLDFEKIVRREVGSFLNGSGGIIAFGVRSNGTILGNKLTRKEEDNFKLAVDRIMILFHPIVKPAMYRLTIESVYDKYKTATVGLYLIQLKVNKGEPYSLYEDGEHEVYVRRGDRPKGPLTARDIKERVTAEYEQRQKEKLKEKMEEAKAKAKGTKSSRLCEQILSGVKKVSNILVQQNKAKVAPKSADTTRKTDTEIVSNKTSEETSKKKLAKVIDTAKTATTTNVSNSTTIKIAAQKSVTTTGTRKPLIAINK